MKKKISINPIIFFILITLLIVSLAINIYYVSALNKDASHTLVGSYGMNQSDTTGTNPYLVFDNLGNYCKYSQQEGVLEEGRYTQDTDKQFSLLGTTGETSKIILQEDGLYYISLSDEPLVTFFPRFYDIPIFIGEWAKEYSGFQK